jgi:S1-C subfamily serine protease
VKRLAFLLVLFLLPTLLYAQCPNGRCRGEWSANRPPAAALRAPAASPDVKPSPGHPAVVRICNDRGRMQSWGSGTLIARDESCGYVLTCWHVFREGPGTITVHFADQSKYAAKLVSQDSTWDLAALRIARPDVAPVIVAAAFPGQGDPVTFGGFGPNGRYQSGSGRALGYARVGRTTTSETLTVSGAARDGDSGGPILNANGELVAVLWGTDGKTVTGTYSGRVRKFLGWSDGLTPAKAAAIAAGDVPLPTDAVASACGCDDPTTCLNLKKLLPRNQKGQAPAPAPQVIVRTDPAVQASLGEMQGTLGVIAANTAPKPEPAAPEGLPVWAIFVCIGAAVLIGVVLVYGVLKK